MSNLCVLPHDEDAEALPGLRLCGPCRRGLERNLRNLPRLWADLGDHLADRTDSISHLGGATPAAYGTGNPTAGTRTREPLTLAETGLPINPAVAGLRDQIKHDLTWWCLFVADQRTLIDRPADTVTDIAQWLLKHVEWIAGHEAAAVECPPVVRSLAARAHHLLNPSGAKRIGIGACHDSTEDGPCGGTIWATCRAEDDVRPSEIYCDGPCGMRKSPEEWRRWGREYLREGRMAV